MKITKVFKKELGFHNWISDDIFCVLFDNGFVFEATANHLVENKTGWVTVSNLKVGEEIVRLR